MAQNSSRVFASEGKWRDETGEGKEGQHKRERYGK